MSSGSQPARGDGDGRALVDVMNSFSLDSRRSRHRRKQDQEPRQQQPVAPQPPPPQPQPPPPPFPVDAEPERPLFGEPPLVPLDELDDPAAIVRPYAWTGGRTKFSKDLAIETLVSTSERGHDESLLPLVEYRTIASLCRNPHSVAEVAAKLSVPLGVARVLLTDMVEQDLITIHRGAAEDDEAAHFSLMERVLSGLRRL